MNAHIGLVLFGTAHLFFQIRVLFCVLLCLIFGTVQVIFCTDGSIPYGTDESFGTGRIFLGPIFCVTQFFVAYVIRYGAGIFCSTFGTDSAKIAHVRSVYFASNRYQYRNVTCNSMVLK